VCKLFYADYLINGSDTQHFEVTTLVNNRDENFLTNKNTNQDDKLQDMHYFDKTLYNTCYFLYKKTRIKSQQQWISYCIITIIV